VLGQDETIDPLVVEDFRRSGLGHLLAVSGQNVVLLCALALPLLAAAGARVRGRVVTLALLILLYVLVAGAGPSLQRAAAMAIAGLAALAVGRARSRWYALLLAASVTLALDPRVAAEPGWQLSFAAVAGILLLAPPLRRRLRGLPGPLADGAAMTVAATLATAPIAGHHFDAVSVAGIAANLAALPLVAPIVWLGMVQAAMGILAGTTPALGVPALDGLTLGAARTLGRVNSALIGALVRCAPRWRWRPPMPSRRRSGSRSGCGSHRAGEPSERGSSRAWPPGRGLGRRRWGLRRRRCGRRPRPPGGAPRSTGASLSSHWRPPSPPSGGVGPPARPSRPSTSRSASSTSARATRRSCRTVRARPSSSTAARPRPAPTACCAERGSAD
jgi:ComEC/Rec2-related protein